MSEWLKEHAWNACIGETLSGVRIPLSPPPSQANDIFSIVSSEWSKAAAFGASQSDLPVPNLGALDALSAKFSAADFPLPFRTFQIRGDAPVMVWRARCADQRVGTSSGLASDSKVRLAGAVPSAMLSTIAGSRKASRRMRVGHDVETL